MSQSKQSWFTAQMPRRLWWMLFCCSAGFLIGIVGNPWLTTVNQQIRATLVCEVIAVGAVISILACSASVNRSNQQLPVSKPSDIDSDRSHIGVVLVLIVISGLWVVLYRDRWIDPSLFADDYHYLRDSADLRTTLQHLFKPYNEHMVVPTRILTWICVQIAATAPLDVSQVMALATIPLFLISLGLTYILARQLWSSEFAALLAVAIFALTTSYREVIWWYSATQWLLTLWFLLAALILVLKSDDQQPMKRLGFVCLLSFAAPFSYSFGILVGPLATVFLASFFTIRKRTIVPIILPTVATLAAIAIWLPTLLSWMKSDEYRRAGGRGILNTFDPFGGVEYGVKLFLDLLLLRNLGINQTVSQLSGSSWFYCLAFLICSIALVACLKQRQADWRLIPCLTLVVLPYALSLPFRTWVDYLDMLIWNRYQLIPQLGIALFVAGLVQMQRFAADQADRSTNSVDQLTTKQFAVLIIVSVSLTILHFRLVFWR